MVGGKNTFTLENFNQSIKEPQCPCLVLGAHPTPC